MFGRETIQQVGLICIIAVFPIAELPQSLVSTSVSFTDTYTLSVVGCSCNPRPEKVWRVPETLSFWGCVAFVWLFEVGVAFGRRFPCPEVARYISPSSVMPINEGCD